MIVLSSYYLDDVQNDRLERAVESYGGRFIPAPGEDRDERVAAIDAHIAEADIFFGGRLTEEQWRRAAKLRWIQVPWAGVNSLLAVEAIRESDLLITNSSGVMSDSVADQTMGYVVMLARDLPAQARASERREWIRYETESPRRQRLRGKTLGIVGYGTIGEAIARRARGFGMTTVATRRSAGDRPPELDQLYPADELGRLLEISDFVVIALPLTDQTRGMIGADELRRMKRSAYLINIARGAIVREAELIQGLRDGVIAGAALDVFETEPLPETSPLWEMENVIVTPHSSGGYMGFGAATVDLFLDNLRRWVGGEPLRNVVQQRAGY